MIKTFELDWKNNYKVNVEMYNSAQDVVADCTSRRITNDRFEDMQDNLGGHTKSWCGVKSYKEAIELLKNGYQPIVDNVKSAIKSSLTGQSKRVSFMNDVVGYAPIVPLAVLGVPASMINTKMKPIKAKVIDVYYDLSVTCNVSSEDILMVGGKIASQIVALEQQGYRFNLYSIQGYSDDKSCDMLCVKVKDAMQPIDLKRISFPLMHTGFFRVIGFDWYSKCPTAKHRWGYGRPFSRELNQNESIKAFKQMFGSNAVYLSGATCVSRKNDIDKYLRGVLTSADRKKQ